MDNPDLNQPDQPTQQPNEQIIPSQPVSVAPIGAPVETQPSVLNQTPNPFDSQIPNQTSSDTTSLVITTEAAASSTTADQTTPKAPNKPMGKKIKLIVIGIIAAALLVGGFFAIKYFFLDNSKQARENNMLETYFNPDNPIPIQIDGKYGFINKDGSSLIAPIYNRISQPFYGNYAVVSGDFGEGTDYTSAVIDKSGAVKLPVLLSDTYLNPEYGVWIIDEVMYDLNLNRLTTEGTMINSLSYSSMGYFTFKDEAKNTIGIVDNKGNVKYTYDLKGTESSDVSLKIADKDKSLSGVYAVFSIIDGESAIIDVESGKVIYDFSKKDISADKDNIFTIKDNNYDTTIVSDDYGDSNKNTMIYVQDGAIVYQIENVDSMYFYNYAERILRIYSYSSLDYNSSYKYYDLDTKQESTETPSVTSSSYSGNSFLKDLGYDTIECGSGGTGLISADKVIVSCGNYDRIDYLSVDVFKYIQLKKSQNIILAENDGKTSIVNGNDNSVLGVINSETVLSNSGSVFIYSDDYDDNKIFIYNLMNNQSMEFDKGTNFKLFSNYFTVNQNGKDIYYNVDSKQIYPAVK